MKSNVQIGCLIVIGILSLFLTSRVSAQENKELYELSLEELMNIDVTTASQKAQKISDAPATVISYSAEQIEKFGWRDLKDIFRSVTGIDVSYDVQGEVKSLVTMRGVEGNQKILILQDGQRQNPITGERFVFGHNMPLNIYKRIEIVFGPSSAIYGADAYAGVINLITKEGKDIDGLIGSVGYVSTNALISSLTFGKQISEDMDVVVYGRIYNGEDFKWNNYYKDSLDYKAVNDYQGQLKEKGVEYPIKNWNILTKLRYKKAIVGFDWQHELETNAPSTIPSNYAYVKNNVWGQDIRHLYLTYKVLTAEKFNLEATATLGDYSLNTASNFYIINSSMNNATPSYKYAYSGYARGMVKVDWKLNSNLNLIGGVSYDNVISFPKTKNLTQPYNLDGGLEDDLSNFVDGNGNAYGLLGLTDSVFHERNFTNSSAFAQGELKVLDKVTITAGARYDYNSLYKGTFNPRLGIVYRTTDKLTIKAMYGTAYIAPSNYYRWENWAILSAIHVPNMNIKPESLQTGEVSINYYATKNLSFRTSIYRNNMKDIIRPVQANAQQGNYPYYNPLRPLIGESTSTGYVETNSNLGEIYSQGLELDVSYQIGKFLFNVGYCYTDGEDKSTSNKIAKVSQHKLNTNVTYSFNKFSASLATRYYSGIWTAVSNSNYHGASEIPGAIIIYSNFSYQITPKVRLNLSADNLLNTKHWGSSPYAESIWIQSRSPQSLLKIFGGLTVNF